MIFLGLYVWLMINGLAQPTDQKINNKALTLKMRNMRKLRKRSHEIRQQSNINVYFFWVFV